MDHVLQEAALLDRSGTDSLKWDALADTFGREDLLPLWVADMDFKTPPCVREALHQAVDQGAFGYYKVPQRFYDSILTWEETRHGVRWEQDWIRTTNGVVSGLFHLVQAVTEPGAGILLLTPVYYPFYSIIEKTGRRTVCCPLREERGIYTVDMAAFEETIRKEKPDFFLLCSPHNPVGRVWTREELAAVGQIAVKHDLWLVSDEIHCDLVRQGVRHTPMGKVLPDYRKLITCMSASKTFNMAGLMFSDIIIRDAAEREHFRGRDKIAGMLNPLSIAAHKAAYEHCGDWLDQLKTYLDENFRFLDEFLKTELPEAVFQLPEATYLAWVDMSRCLPDVEDLPGFFANEAGVLLEGGDSLFVGNAKGYIRLNLAMPRSIIATGLMRMRGAIRRHRAQQ